MFLPGLADLSQMILIIDLNQAIKINKNDFDSKKSEKFSLNTFFHKKSGIKTCLMFKAHKI